MSDGESHASPQLERLRKRAAQQFDVFLCHHSPDKPAVALIAQKLQEQGVLPWLDLWELIPGRPWQRELERQISNIKSAAVFVGMDGVGPWQQQELYGFLDEFVSRQMPVCTLSAYAPPTMGSSPSSWRIARARAWAALSSGSSAGARCTSRSGGRPGREANAGRPARRHPGSRAGGWSLAKKNNFFSAPGGRAPPGPAGLVGRAMAPARLAEGAEECAPAALDDALDRRPACEAGFSGAVVHEEEVLAALFDIGDRLRAVLLVQRGAD